jgi:hypothetical protein
MAARNLEQHYSNAPPSNSGDVPGEAQRLNRERSAAEQDGQVVSAKQTRENVALTQYGVRETRQEYQKCGYVECVCHRSLERAIDCATLPTTQSTSLNDGTGGPYFVRGNGTFSNTSPHICFHGGQS